MKDMISKLRDRIKEKVSGLRLILALGLAGVLLILISCFSETESRMPDSDSSPVTCGDFAEVTERRLEDILGRMDGVGRVSVMVAVSGTQEKIYEQEIKESDSGEKGSRQSENSVVIVQHDGDRDALVRKTVNPEISGVVVVCSGGKSSAVRERICNAVSVALGIDTCRICVEEYSK